MSLQERTLVIKNFDPDKTTPELLRELCMQTGPVRNVVLRPDHAFIEYEDVESVGYSKALLDGIRLFERTLILEPKLRQDKYFKYTESLKEYIAYDKRELEPRRRQEQQIKLIQANQMNTLPQGMLAPYQQQTNPPIAIPQPPVTQNFIQPTLLMNQTAQFQPQIYVPQQYQQYMPTQSLPQSTYQASSDILRFQFVQSSQHVAYPLRPAPEGRAYVPWIHEQPSLNRSRSFHQHNNNMQNQQQRRRVSDRPVNFTQRRR